MDRNKLMLLKRIEKIQFAIFEIRLFLDTHPDNMHAIKHYEHYQNKLNETVKEYERMYGTIKPNFTANGDRWTWCDGPWPWECEFNEL